MIIGKRNIEHGKLYKYTVSVEFEIISKVYQNQDI